MAESFINVTEGSGKKAHTFQRTIGANNVEDDVVIAGEPYLATYTFQTSNTSVGTAAAHALQIMAGASLHVYVRLFLVTQSVVATTAALARLNIVRLTTAGTGGTVVTPSSFDTGDAAAGATGMTLPTVKGAEGASLWLQAAMYIQTVPTGGPASAPTLFDRDYRNVRSKSIRIPAGAANGIAVKVTDAVAGANVVLMAEIVEANF
jgi:hypothetical protein